MDDFLVVTVNYSRQDLLHILSSDFLSERVHGLNSVKQLTSCTEPFAYKPRILRHLLSDKVVIVLILIELIKFNDVRMIEILKNADFREQFFLLLSEH